jgi:hypothetical protein
MRSAYQFLPSSASAAPFFLLAIIIAAPPRAAFSFDFSPGDRRGFFLVVTRQTWPNRNPTREAWDAGRVPASFRGLVGATGEMFTLAPPIQPRDWIGRS